MKNEKLQVILDTYHKRSNKDLANVLITLEKDFNKIKDVLLELTETVKEIELTYDTLYNELEKRVKIR